jgi:hypothetical protein
LFNEKVTKSLVKPSFRDGIGTRLNRCAQFINGLSPRGRRENQKNEKNKNA